MELLTDVDELPAGLRFVIAVGMFDGVHRGHSRMLRTEVEAAARLAAPPVALTFDPHPEAVLRGAPPPLLCDPAEKVALLAAAGARLRRRAALRPAVSPTSRPSRSCAGWPAAGRWPAW